MPSQSSTGCTVTDGVLAVAWQDARFSGGARDGIAFSRRSTDGGNTWSAPVRVNADPTVAAFLPTIAIRDDGVIGVGFFDFRANTPDPNTLLTNVWLATSTDGAAWQEHSLAAPFDYFTAPLAGGSLFLGDYMGLASFGNTFVPFLRADHRRTRRRSDVFASLRRSPVPTPFAREAAAVAPDRLAAALPMTPEISARLTAAARTALARRLPEGILPGRWSPR